MKNPKKYYCRFKLLFIVLLLFSSPPSNSDIVKLFETKRYSVLNQGARSLSFKVDMPEMMQSLKESTNFSNLDRVSTHVKWEIGKSPEVTVDGLGDRFVELQQMIKNLVLVRLDYIVPKPLSDFTNGYQLTESKLSDSIVLKGVDKEGKKEINQFEMVFNNQGIIKELRILSPGLNMLTSFDYMIFPWSNNKYVLSQVRVIEEKNLYKTEISSVLKYKLVDGYGLPEEISLTSKNYSTGKTEAMIQHSVVKFSNYQVNQ